MAFSRIRADNYSWKEFTQTLPAQKGMFTRIAPAKLSRWTANVPCADVFTEGEHEGPQELMSMLLCFCGAMEKTNTTFLINNMHALQRASRENKRNKKHNPVLMVLLKSTL